MREFLLTSFFTLILSVHLVNSPNMVPISVGNPDDAAIVDNNTNLDVSNLVYDVHAF